MEFVFTIWGCTMNDDKLDTAILFMVLLSGVMIALVYFPYFLGLYYG